MEAIINECKMLMHEIKFEYSNQMYQRITDDKKFEKVPKRIWELWYSNEEHAIAICNLDSLFLKVISGEESVHYMHESLSRLRDELANEFALLKKESIKKGE